MRDGRDLMLFRSVAIEGAQEALRLAQFQYLQQSVGLYLSARGKHIWYSHEDTFSESKTLV